MIIVRSPLRITLGGGGTDLASYYREHGGFLIAAAIDKFVYVTVIKPFRLSFVSRRFAPFGIWLSLLWPSPAQP